jgi:hypothetical protein
VTLTKCRPPFWSGGFGPTGGRRAEPGAPTRTVSLPAGLHDLNGTPRTSVTLGPASGAVLLR